MKTANKLSLLIVPIILTTGCGSTFFSSLNSETICFKDDGSAYDCPNGLSMPEPRSNVLNNVEQDPTLFSSNVNFNMLSDYVAQMTMELHDDLKNMDIINSVTVASFVELDSSLNNTNTLGNQIAEYFINELQQFGIPVNDNKVTGYIQMTKDGDFAFSRNVAELEWKENIGYVLSGTMSRNDKGIVINARIIGLTSNKVIASTSKLIPNIMLSAI
jgi:TolB-like protein